ncbi:hypothetical protein Tco_0959053 [Tanacetum coccineum]
MAAPVDASFRRSVRGGIELVQFNELRAILESVSLSHSLDRWICNASSDGSFRVKDIRNVIDDLILPSELGVILKKMLIIFFCNVILLIPSCGVFVDGGILIGSLGLLFTLGTVGSLLSRLLLTTRRSWNVFSMWLGGPYGCFGTVCSSMINLPFVR